MSFFREFSLKTYQSYAYCVETNWFGWTVLINSKILFTKKTGLAGQFWLMVSALLDFVTELERSPLVHSNNIIIDYKERRQEY